MIGRATRAWAIAGGVLLLPHPASAGPPAATAPSTAPAPTSPPPAGLRLEQAIRLVLTRNERVRISDLAVVVAEAGVERARAGFLPVVVLAGNDQQHAYPSTDRQPNNVGGASATVNQPLVNASAYPLYAQAKHLAESQRAQNVDDKRLLEFAAASAFFGVLNAQDVLEAARHQLETAQANLDYARARADAGLTSTNDVTRAQIDLASSTREVDLDEGNLANASVQLGYLMNAPIPGPLAPPDATMGAAARALPQTEELVRLARERRPDVLVDREAAAAAHAFADEPLLRIVPTLGLQGQATTTTNSVASGRWHDEVLQATLTWTAYDAGIRYADKHARDAQAEIADLNLRLLLRNVEAQVASAAALLDSAQSAFRVAGEAVDAARRSVDETEILYRQGLARGIELVNANDTRFVAEINYASASFALSQAYLGLRQALGLDALGTELR